MNHYTVYKDFTLTRLGFFILFSRLTMKLCVHNWNVAQSIVFPAWIPIVTKYYNNCKFDDHDVSVRIWQTNEPRHQTSVAQRRLNRNEMRQPIPRGKFGENSPALEMRGPIIRGKFAEYNIQLSILLPSKPTKIQSESLCEKLTTFAPERDWVQ